MNYNYNSRGALPPSALHQPENVFRLQHQSFKTSHLLNHKNYNSQSSTPLNKEGNISKIKYLESTVSQPMLLRRQDDEQSPIANEMKIYSNSIKYSQIAKNQSTSVHKSSRKLLEPLSFKKNVELFIPQTVTMNQISSHVSQSEVISSDFNQPQGSQVVSSKASNIFAQHHQINNQSLLVHNRSLELDVRQNLVHKQQLRPLNNTQIGKTRQAVTRHSPSQKNDGSLWEGIKAQTNMQRIMNVLEKMHNKNLQVSNKSREDVITEQNISIIENSNKLNNDSSNGLANLFSERRNESHPQNLNNVNLENLPPRQPRKQIPIIISDSSNPKYPDLSPNRIKISISPQGIKKLPFRLQQPLKQNQTRMSDFVDMQIKVKPLLINNNLLIEKRSTTQVGIKEPPSIESPIKNLSTLNRSDLQNENSIIKLPQLPKHQKEDSGNLPHQSEYQVLVPPQMQQENDTIQNHFSNSVTENSIISLNDYYKVFPQRASLNSLNKIHKNHVQAVTNDSVFPAKLNISQSNQEQFIQPISSVSHSPLNFSRKQIQPKQMMPTESQKEAARRFVKKITKKKLEENVLPKNVYQGLKIDRNLANLLENDNSKFIANNNTNSQAIVAPIPSQVILFSIVNPLPPGTADTINTSQLLRQDTTFMDQVHTPTNLTNFVNRKNQIIQNQSLTQPIMINQNSSIQILQNQTPTKHSKHETKIQRQELVNNNRSLAIKQINTYSRSSSKQDIYSASHSIFSNPRGLEDSHKVSAWETRYKDAHRQKETIKKHQNSNQKNKQHLQVQPNSETMNTPYSISHVLGETINHNNHQMSWKNSSREQTIEDESSLERQQQLS